MLENGAAEHENAADAESGHPRRWAILGVLVVVLVIVVLDNTILNVALRVLSDPVDGLGATQSQLAWMINSYTLLFAGLLITWGVIGDRVGHRRILIVGLALFGLASLLSAYAQSPEQLIAARALKGLGGAAVMPQTLAIITNVFSARQRARAIGIWAGAVGIALAIGPPLGGLLLVNFWWGSVFLINVPVVIVGIVLAAWLVPQSRNPEPGRLDPVGVVLSIAGLVLLVYGIITAGDRGSFAEADTIAATLAGLAVLAGFFWWEARSDHPALNVRLFKDPRMTVAVAAIMLVFFAMAGVMFFGNFYLQSVREFSPLQAGLLIIPLAVGQLIFSPLSPSLVTRWGARAVCATGVVVLAFALGAYALFGLDTPVAAISVAFFVQGAAMASVMVPATNSIMAVTPREQAGAASAVQNTARQVAVALGVAVLGTLLSLVYRSSIASSLAEMPRPVRAADASIEETLAAARELGPSVEAAILDPAKHAFLSGMHTVALCSFAIALLGALTVWIWMPGRDAERRDSAAPEASTAGRTSAG